MKESIRKKDNIISYSDSNRTRTRTINALVLLASGVLLLALLTLFTSHTIVHAAPFLSPAEIKISPKSGPAGTEIAVEGSYFTPQSTISIRFDGNSVNTSPKTVSVKADGEFIAEFNVPDVNADVDDVKTVRAIDNSIFRNSASASFEVIASGGSSNDGEEGSTDDAAAARSQSVTIDEDTSRVIALKASHQDDTVHFSIRDNPSHGSLSEFDSEAGTVLYTPYADYFGSDRFTFRVQGSDAVGTVSITIREINDSPTARNQQVETLEESAVQFTLSGSDVDVGDAVTFTIVGVPTHGRLSGTAPNITYLPDKDYYGLDSFRFRTSDGTADSDIATFSIRVTGVNDPPVVDAQTNIITKENDDVRITLIATDIDSQTISFSIVSDPEHGILTEPMTTAPHVAIATYTPNPNYAGRDTFTFTVNDGTEDNGVSNTGSVSILVGSPVNISDEPVGGTNIAESSEPSLPEGSGNQADVGNGEIDDALNGGADINDSNDSPSNISTGDLFDVIPPSLIVPSRSIIIDASTLIGATVNYESTANDNVDGPVAIHCYPRSGLMFPVGESVVKCNATDKAGNTSERAFGVIVRPFKLDASSLLPISIAVIIAGIGVATALIVIRKRRNSFLDKDIMKQRN